MRALRFLTIAFSVWALSALTILAAPAPAPPNWRTDAPPPPPENGIRDQSNYFQRHADQKRRILENIHQLRQQHGFQLYLIIEPVFIATSPSRLAAELQKSWNPDNNGIVIVFEADSRKIGFGRPIDVDPSVEPHQGQIPTHEADALLARATHATDRSLAPELSIEALIDNITGELNQYFSQRDAPPPPARSMRLMLLTIAALCLVGLATIAVVVLSRIPSMTKQTIHRFPEVDRPERLGAPCGGGNVTVRSYRNPPPLA